MPEPESPTAPEIEAPPTYGALVEPPAPIVSDLPAPPAPKSIEEQLAELHEQNARLTGQLEEARRPAPAEPPRPAAAPMTYAQAVESVEALYRAGEITELQRTEQIADLKFEQRERDREVQQRRQASQQRVSDRLNAYVARYPALKDGQSELVQKYVIPKLHELVDEGLDPMLAETQVKALDAFVADGVMVLRALAAPTPDPNEHHRRRIPVGGGPSGGGPVEPTPAKSMSKGERLFNNLAPQHQQFFIAQRGSKEAAIKTLEHADEDMLRRNGRLVA